MTSERPLAIVTGASSGIGYELAKQFGEHGFDLIVIAENDEITAAAERLRQSGAEVQGLKADLATSKGVDEVYAKVKAQGRDVDALAINAGIGVAGHFAESDLGAQVELLNLNVISPVHMTRRMLPQMLERGSGRILYTASIAATAPGPYMATYNASKAFLKSFAEAIREEVKDNGVTVTTLMPGETETKFFERAGLEDTKLGQKEKDDPAEVARDGFEALMDGKDHIVAGSFKNKVKATLAHVLPDTMTSKMQARETMPGSAQER